MEKAGKRMPYLVQHDIPITTAILYQDASMSARRGLATSFMSGMAKQFQKSYIQNAVCTSVRRSCITQ